MCVQIVWPVQRTNYASLIINKSLMQLIYGRNEYKKYEHSLHMILEKEL